MIQMLKEIALVTVIGITINLLYTYWIGYENTVIVCLISIISMQAINYLRKEDKSK